MQLKDNLDLNSIKITRKLNLIKFELKHHKALDMVEKFVWAFLVFSGVAWLVSFFVFIRSFCISRRVRRSSFHYALAFPVRSPYLRSTCFSICSSSFVQGNIDFLIFFLRIFSIIFLFLRTFIYLLVEFVNVFSLVSVFQVWVSYSGLVFYLDSESMDGRWKMDVKFKW